MTKPSALHNHLYYFLHTNVFISTQQYNGTAHHCNITWLLPEDYLTITLTNTCFEITELRSSRSWRERQCCTACLWHIALTNPTLHVHSFQEKRVHVITCNGSGGKVGDVEQRAHFQEVWKLVLFTKINDMSSQRSTDKSLCSSAPLLSLCVLYF